MNQRNLVVVVVSLVCCSTVFADDRAALAVLEKAGVVVERDENRPNQPVTQLTYFLRQVTPEGIQALKELTELPEISFIGSGDTELTAETLRALQKKSSLKRLSISFAKVSEDAAIIIGTLQSLESLNLQRQVELAPEGFDAIFHLKGLKELTLSGRLIDDDLIPELVRLSSLNTLTLESIFVTDQGIAFLKRLKQLKTLRIHIGSEVTKVGIAKLAELKLDQIEITYLDVNNDKLKELRPLSGLKSLRMLNAAKVSDDGIPYLTELRDLKELDLNDAMLTKNGIKELRSSLPACKVVHDARTRN